MSRCFIVIRSEGQYDSYWQENICAYVYEEVAIEFVRCKNEQINRIVKAREAKEEYLSEWRSLNPEPSYNTQARKRINDIERVPNNKRTKKQLNDLDKMVEQQHQVSIDKLNWRESEKNAEKEFIFGLAYLTDEDRQLMSDNSFNFTTHYFIEELELK